MYKIDQDSYGGKEIEVNCPNNLAEVMRRSPY
jgi:hypothetical protein